MRIYRGELPDGLDQRVFLNMRASELTELGMRIAAKRLGQRLSKDEARAIKEADPKERYIRLRERLGDGASEALARATGKVGIVVSPASGKGGDVFAVFDGKYGESKKHTKEVNADGMLPEFAAKLAKVKGKPDMLDERVVELAKKSKIYNSSGSPSKAYLQQIIKLKDKIAIDVRAMNLSLTRIKDGVERAMDAKRSVEQGIRFALIDEAKKNTEGKMCRMLGTAAAEPDFEHSLLEGQVMPCEDVLNHLSRWGCQHNYEVID